MVRRSAGHLLDRPWTLIAIGAAALLVYWAVGTRSQPHHVKASFQTAIGIRPGLDIQMAGIDVGKVSDVTYSDGRAIVSLGIDDDAWPLRRGTTATLRFGTTVGNGTRRVDLLPGPRSAPALAEGGVIPARDTITPVEFDDVFNTFDARTRDRVRSVAGRAARSVDGAARPIAQALRRGPAATEAVAGLMGDLAADEVALDGLMIGADRLTRTLAPRRAEISDLVAVAAATFDTLGRHSADVRTVIGDLPATLARTRTTLARLDRTSVQATGLMRTLAPGTARLPRLATDLSRASVSLRDVAPRAVRAADTAITVAPATRRLLDRATPFLRDVRPLLTDLAPAVACLRPYAPEVAGTLTNWAGFSGHYDSLSHYGRIHAVEGATSVNANPLTSAEFLRAVPGLKYAMPRPPGLNAGQPWFQPECGAGPDALDATKDPEAAR